MTLPLFWIEGDDVREVRIDAWCDRCWADEGARTLSAGAVTMAIMPGDTPHPTPKVLDFCEAHMVEVKALALLVADSAVLPSKRQHTSPQLDKPVADTPARRTVICPVCKTQQFRASLVGHVWGSHRKDARPEIPLTCSDCGTVYTSAQGAATHRRLAHDYDALLDALSGVKGYKPTGREREL